jgi:cell division protein FtsL
MRIAATALAGALTLASAWVLYAEGSATRRLEAQVQAAERQRERLESEITVLKAERAWLSRPARIEPAAKALGLRPPVAGEHVEMGALLPRPGGDRTGQRP